MSKTPGNRLDRRAVVATIMAERGDALVVTGLGNANWDCTAAGDRNENFPLWGAMGNTATIGLGLALAQPKRRVLVITGDGDMMMGVGSLATIADAAPGNLTILVLDNEHHGETGMQRGLTAGRADLARMAEGSGIEDVRRITTAAEVEEALPWIYQATGPIFATIKVDASNPPRVMPPRDGATLKDRFRRALLGPDALL